MEHSAEATEDIQNEMVLQMSFKNRCVVAAYKCLTYARSAAAAGSSCDSTNGGEFALYVAPMSTHNSTSHSTPGGPLNATPGGLDADWRGLSVNCTAGSSGTPPLAATSSRQKTSSRASVEGQQPPTKLATWLLQVIDKGLYHQAISAAVFLRASGTTPYHGAPFSGLPCFCWQRSDDSNVHG
jgi:hypothetical protein